MKEVKKSIQFLSRNINNDKKGKEKKWRRKLQAKKVALINNNKRISVKSIILYNEKNQTNDLVSWHENA